MAHIIETYIDNAFIHPLLPLSCYNKEKNSLFPPSKNVFHQSVLLFHTTFCSPSEALHLLYYVTVRVVSVSITPAVDEKGRRFTLFLVCYNFFFLKLV